MESSRRFPNSSSLDDPLQAKIVKTTRAASPVRLHFMELGGCSHHTNRRGVPARAPCPPLRSRNHTLSQPPPCARDPRREQATVRRDRAKPREVARSRHSRAPSRTGQARRHEAPTGPIGRLASCDAAASRRPFGFSACADAAPLPSRPRGRSRRALPMGGLRGRRRAIGFVVVVVVMLCFFCFVFFYYYLFVPVRLAYRKRGSKAAKRSPSGSTPSAPGRAY